MTSTQVKKLSAYPEWSTPSTCIQVLNYTQSISEDEEEPQYPPGLSSVQKTRYKQKFSKDFIVEPLNSEQTTFYQPHVQGQQSQRTKVPVAKPSQHQEVLRRTCSDDRLGLGVGLDQFYYQVCSQYIGTKRTEARAFLRQQGNYQISRPIKKAVSQPTLSKTPSEVWGVDTTYMSYLQTKTKKSDEGEREPREVSEETGGVESVESKLTKSLSQLSDDGTKGYTTTVVDFFSKKVWARALSQNSGEQVLEALRSICSESSPSTYPHTLITDSGKEFTSQDFNKFCKDSKVVHRVAQSYKPTTSGLTERMSREIRKKIKAGFIRSSSLEWVSKLQTYCDSISSQRQSTTGYKPVELWKPLYKPVKRGRLPSPELKPSDLSSGKELRQRTEARVLSKASAILKTQRVKKLQVGDKVRVKLTATDSKYRQRNKDGLEKKKTAVTYSPKVYKVSKLVSDVATPNNSQYQSSSPYKRLKYYLKYQDSDGEWKEMGTEKDSRFQPTSFFRSDLWVVPSEDSARPTVRSKHRADTTNFLKPYPSINQERLDEEERQRQAADRQRQEQLRLEREERLRQRQQEEEERRERRVGGEEQSRLEQQRLQQQREERLQRQQEALRTQQEALRKEQEERARPTQTSSGRVSKKSTRYL